ncbi:hypothetical protein GGI42DRAFT_310595 [Trichoderma sp. SZMC 28013]
MEKVKLTVPGIETTKRVTLWPWMMPGSKFPIVNGDGVPRYPTELKMSFTRLNKIDCYGLASYARPSSKSGQARPEISRDKQDVRSKYAAIILPK